MIAMFSDPVKCSQQFLPGMQVSDQLLCLAQASPCRVCKPQAQDNWSTAKAQLLIRYITFRALLSADLQCEEPIVDKRCITGLRASLTFKCFSCRFLLRTRAVLGGQQMQRKRPSLFWTLLPIQLLWRRKLMCCPLQ